MLAKNSLARLLCFDLFFDRRKLVFYQYVVWNLFLAWLSWGKLGSALCSCLIIAHISHSILFLIVLILLLAMLFTSATVPFVSLLFVSSYAPWIIKGLILLRIVRNPREVESTTPLIMILYRRGHGVPESPRRVLTAFLHDRAIKEIVAARIWLSSAATVAPPQKLRFGSLKLALSLPFNLSPKLTMVDRLAEPVDVHVIHGALTFKRFARTALLQLLLLLGCLFGPFGGYHARISLQHWWVIIVLSVPPARPGRPFGSVGAGWPNRPHRVRSCWHWLLQFELEQFLLGLSMLFSFWATLDPTTVDRVGAGEHWEVSVLNVSSLERCSAFGEASATATMLPIHSMSSYRTSLRVSSLQ